MRSLVLLLLPAALATGCPASLEGQIDGQDVPQLVSAFFTQTTLGSGDGERSIVTGTASSVNDGCNTVTEQQTARNEAFQAFLDETDGTVDAAALKAAKQAQVEAEVNFATKNFPPDFWSAVISGNAADGDNIDGGESEIDREDPDSDQDILANVTVCHTLSHPSLVEDDNGFPELHKDEDCFVANTGNVDFDAWDEDKQLDATAEVDLVRNEEPDADVGSIKVSMVAQHCPSLEVALDEFEDIAEQFAD